MNHVLVDTADVAELIEILEYFIEELDNALRDDRAATSFTVCTSYRTGDLRTDITSSSIVSTAAH
jgi:hypothetical protein